MLSIVRSTSICFFILTLIVSCSIDDCIHEVVWEDPISNYTPHDSGEVFQNKVMSLTLYSSESENNFMTDSTIALEVYNPVEGFSSVLPEFLTDETGRYYRYKVSGYYTGQYRKVKLTRKESTITLGCKEKCEDSYYNLTIVNDVVVQSFERIE